MNNNLAIQITNIPARIGVYIFKDSNDFILYIGKAKSLRNRVKSYFQKEYHSSKIAVMVPQISSIEFITTDSEIESLILEDTLIKKHKPKYNTLLKDDKKFPWIEITDEDYPRILVTRNPNRKKKKRSSKYFGPYVNAGALYSTLDFVKQIFPLKQCKTPVFKNKPCINYHIHRCLGPCQNLVTPEKYKQVVEQIELFLSGKQSILNEKLKNMMQQASTDLEFEKAAKYRDTIEAIGKIIDNQIIVSDDNSIEQDIFAFKNDDINIAIVLLRIREGKLVYKEGFDLKLEESNTPVETFWAFLEKYYKTINSNQIPKEIIVPYLAEDYELLSLHLSKERKRKVIFIIPKAQKKYKLLQMAKSNAELTLLTAQQKTIRMLQNDWNKVGITLEEKLKLERFPRKLECFDISHLSGIDTVASMVVFHDGKPVKSEYKRYKLKTTEGKIDDFASMIEVVTRRYSRLLNENTPLPDLIIIDGGKGQLSSAIKAFKKLGVLDPPVVSLAKKLEEVFIYGQKEPVIFDNDSPALYLFQQIRDEAHRFAITYQRNLRSKRMTKSSLDELVSIGKQRKNTLLKHFGSVDKIYKASIEELTVVAGINIKLAKLIYSQLNPANKDPISPQTKKED